MKFDGLIRLLGRLTLILFVALTANLILAFYYEEAILPFAIPAILNLIAHLFLQQKTKNKAPTPFKKKEAYLTVSIAWFLMATIGALPYVISQEIPSLVDAWFESVSGFTTTGSSILTDIEILPKSLLFWRSLTHWIGGIGIILLVIIIMPGAKLNNYSIFSLESSVREKIHPRIRSVGFRLLIIYVLLTVSEILLLLLGNMNLYESVCHAFGTVSTGGFSPKNTSIIAYSPYIQYVISIFMILGGTNFIVHYYILHRQFDKVRKNEELRFYLKTILISTIFITVFLVLKTDRSIEKSFRDAFFQVSSIVTCTGFASDDYLLWPGAASVVIFILLFAGGSTGSTSGGIKMARHLLAMKSIQNHIRSQIHPNAVYVLKLNNKIVSSSDSNAVIAYIYWYLLAFVVGSVMVISTGVDIVTSTSGIATAMGGIGPGFGTIGPVSNFAHLPDLAKLILALFMILGRLEIYTVVVILSASFWKK
ncbi:MAG: trk system potassium uptake protein TrkH [Bacteroidetes bacterium]|nr:MAG: trk system potassium uptake protein TrkH [Bacteroidota bacterium]